MNAATIRPLSEILDQLDLIFRLSWVMRKTESGAANEMTLNRGVAHERYHAITWITFVRDQWEEA